MRLPPAVGIVVGPNTSTSLLIIGGRALLKGFSLRETTETADCEIRLHDGVGASNNFLAVINLNPQESIRDWYTGMGVLVDRGIYCEIENGSCEGCIYVIPGEQVPENVTVPVGPAGYPISTESGFSPTIAPPQRIIGT